MTCNFPSILNLNDGTTSLDVHGYAMLRTSITHDDTRTGHGEIEYSDGSARRWVRFERRIWVITGGGPAPSGLWSLLLTVATWTATFPDPDNPGSNVVVTVVPARPVGYTNDRNTADRSWSLELREAAAR